MGCRCCHPLRRWLEVRGSSLAGPGPQQPGQGSALRDVREKIIAKQGEMHMPEDKIR